MKICCWFGVSCNGDNMINILPLFSRAIPRFLSLMVTAGSTERTWPVHDKLQHTYTVQNSR